MAINPQNAVSSSMKIQFYQQFFFFFERPNFTFHMQQPFIVFFFTRFNAMKLSCAPVKNFLSLSLNNINLSVNDFPCVADQNATQNISIATKNSGFAAQSFGVPQKKISLHFFLLLQNCWMKSIPVYLLTKLIMFNLDSQLIYYRQTTKNQQSVQCLICTYTVLCMVHLCVHEKCDTINIK